ncbi:hypothetical protein FRB90_001499, partial [Tulasnella sp. 427]
RNLARLKAVPEPGTIRPDAALTKLPSPIAHQPRGHDVRVRSTVVSGDPLRHPGGVDCGRCNLMGIQDREEARCGGAKEGDRYGYWRV